MMNKADKMPNKIEVDHDRTTIIVDGEPFPFTVSPGAVQCGYDSQGAPVVKLAILADEVVEKSGVTETIYRLIGKNQRA